MRSILYCSILILLSELVTLTPTQDSFYDIIKRNFLSREREYLKKKPLSDDLKKFIQRVKRRAKTPKKRDSPGSADKDHMYVVHNGDIIPLSNLKARGLENNYVEGVVTMDNKEEPTNKFTVIPLIIPISIGALHQTGTETCEVASKPRATTPRSSSKMITTPEPQQLDEESESDPLLETTTANVKLLSKVIKDVEDLIKFQNDAKFTSETNLCNVSGDWDSYAGGMQLRVYLKEDSHNPRVRIVPREPPMEGFLADNRWNVTALLPDKHSSMIAIMAVSEKGRRVVSFIGECRVCEGDETISGNWMLSRRSKSCKDREETSSLISDVLRKNNVRMLQAAHLSQITMSSPENDFFDATDDNG